MHEFFVAIFGEWTPIFYVVIVALCIGIVFALIAGAKRDAMIPLSSSKEN